MDTNRRTAAQAPRQPDHDEDEDRDDEPVRGDREHRSRLPRTPQVRERHEQHEQDGQQDPVFVRPLERRPDREHARHDGNHHGHHVVEQQGGGRDQAWKGSEVVLAHDVRAAAARVGTDGLSVRAHDDRHQQGDRDRDRHHVGLGVRGDEGERDQDLARRVGDRRQGVGGEHRKREHLRQQRVLQLLAGERSAHEEALDDRGRGGVRRLCHGR